MIKPKRYTHWLDFYPGGVPAGVIFDMNVLDACQIANTNPSNQDDLRRGIGAEFALIGLLRTLRGSVRTTQQQFLTFVPSLFAGWSRVGVTLDCGPSTSSTTRKTYQRNLALWSLRKSTLAQPRQSTDSIRIYLGSRISQSAKQIDSMHYWKTGT